MPDTQRAGTASATPDERNRGEVDAMRRTALLPEDWWDLAVEAPAGDPAGQDVVALAPRTISCGGHWPAVR